MLIYNDMGHRKEMEKSGYFRALDFKDIKILYLKYSTVDPYNNAVVRGTNSCVVGNLSLTFDSCKTELPSVSVGVWF